MKDFVATLFSLFAPSPSPTPSTELNSPCVPELALERRRRQEEQQQQRINGEGISPSITDSIKQSLAPKQNSTLHGSVAPADNINYPCK